MRNDFGGSAIGYIQTTLLCDTRMCTNPTQKGHYPFGVCMRASWGTSVYSNHSIPLEAGPDKSVPRETRAAVIKPRKLSFQRDNAKPATLLRLAQSNCQLQRSIWWLSAFIENRHRWTDERYHRERKGGTVSTHPSISIGKITRTGGIWNHLSQQEGKNLDCNSN